MSDEALNAHLDWLDKCAQEQGDIYDELLGNARLDLLFEEWNETEKDGDSWSFDHFLAWKIAQLEDALDVCRMHVQEFIDCDVDEHIAQLEVDKDRLLEQLVAGEELYISRGIELAQLEAENAALKRENERLKTYASTLLELALDDVDLPLLAQEPEGEDDVLRNTISLLKNKNERLTKHVEDYKEENAALKRENEKLKQDKTKLEQEREQHAITIADLGNIMRVSDKTERLTMVYNCMERGLDALLTAEEQEK